jgi:hypothetical protein
MAAGAKLLALLPKGLGEEAGPEEESESPEDPTQQAARDFFEAGTKGDWSAASEALETFVLNCQSKYKGDSDDDGM